VPEGGISVKRLIVAALLLSPLAAATARTARADYGYGGFGPGYFPYYERCHPYYDRWRPWWGSLCGWTPFHGCSGYPAYSCARTSGYRFCPGYYPPSSSYYGYPDYNGGYGFQQYPRTFVYDWSPEAGDQAPQDGSQPEPQQVYQAP
jgi:hypothetical protein